MEKTLMDFLFHRSVKLSVFIDLMRKCNFPFTLEYSAAADFYITNGDSVEDTEIIMCLPSCFEVAEYFLKEKTPKLLKDIENVPEMHKLFKDSNYRDIFIENSNLIYVNPWELHTVLDIGESQRFALLLLAKYGYINESIINHEKFHYHHKLLEFLAEKKLAIKRNCVTKNEFLIPVYFMHYSILPLNIQAKIDGYVKYKCKYGINIENHEKCFWRVDTSHNILGYMSEEESNIFLNENRYE